MTTKMFKHVQILYTTYIIVNDDTGFIEAIGAFPDDVLVEQIMIEQLEDFESIAFFARGVGRTKTYCKINAIKRGEITVNGWKYFARNQLPPKPVKPVTTRVKAVFI